MATAVLIVIYLSFISLGLPDTLLGAAWPVMRADLGASLDMAGVISLIISFGTVMSSLLSGRLLARFGTGRVAFFSVLLTAVGLFGFSCSRSFYGLLIMAVPLGLGAGAVDAGLNSFVAAHYKPRHMSFLHCFWGLGAMSGPAIMSFWIAADGRWDMGYRTAASVQAVLVAVMALTLPLWKGLEGSDAIEKTEKRQYGTLAALRIPGVKTVLAAFFCYCSLEITAGLWASSYLSACRGASADTAALCTSLFYCGIAAGRLIAGVISNKMQSKTVIRAGQGACAVGCLLLILPVAIPVTILGLLLFGLGCAPLYPAMLQGTPQRVGRAATQTVMGLQLAVAYVGSSVMPTLFGILAQHTTIAVLPWFLLGAIAAMLLLCERLNRFLGQKSADNG